MSGSESSDVPAALVDRFRQAVRDRDADAVGRLIEEHPEARSLLDEPLFSFDSPALVHVAGHGHLPLVEALLQLGADPNRRSDWWAGGFHALHGARGAEADLLIEAGAVPDACAAANLDRPELLQGILDAEPDRVHDRGGDGQTPLHFARSREVVDLLLERGADIDAVDVDHRATPAQWMLESRRGAGRYALAAYLVERGAAADVFLSAALGLTDRLRAMLQDDPSLLALRTGRGPYAELPPSSFHIYTWTIGQNLSPLQVAARFEQSEALEVMRSFASTKERFLAACSQADGDRARALLRDHPTLVEELSPEDMRALPDAAWAPNAAAVELMLELGFDPKARDSNGGSALHCAAWEGDVAGVRAVLRHPAAPALLEDRDPTYGGTPFNWACHGAAHCGNPNADHAGVARLLLEAGAPAPSDLQGIRPDILAVLRGHAG